MIQFKNVYKSFGDKEVLKGISFEVKKGEILFILGTSGTGKSVLLKNIVGLLKPSRGEIWVDQQEVSRLTERELFPIRKKCGMVFQHPALFDSLTIFENVAFGIRRHFQWGIEEIRKKVQECLKAVHLGEDIELKKPAQLSYGMQKRVSLARTLAVGPEVLLYDEPTTGLDPVTTNAINLLIKELSEEFHVTSVVVSHDIQCALDIAHRIIFLDQGQIIEEGSPESIMKSSHPLVRSFLEEVV